MVRINLWLLSFASFGRVDMLIQVKYNKVLKVSTDKDFIIDSYLELKSARRNSNSLQLSSVNSVRSFMNCA